MQCVQMHHTLPKYLLLSNARSFFLPWGEYCDFQLQCKDGSTEIRCWWWLGGGGGGSALVLHCASHVDCPSTMEAGVTVVSIFASLGR